MLWGESGMNDQKGNSLLVHNKLVVFQDKKIRRAWYNEEWYYSLVDIVAVLTESKDPTDYLKKIIHRYFPDIKTTTPSC